MKDGCTEATLASTSTEVRKYGSQKALKLCAVCSRQKLPENVSIGVQCYEQPQEWSLFSWSSQARPCPDPRLTSSPGSPGSPARPASPCTQRMVRASGLLASPLLCLTLMLEAQIHSPFHPVVRAVLGHLWLPTDKRVRGPRMCQSQTNLKEVGLRPGSNVGESCEAKSQENR